jgi:hypothetical protein
MELEVQYGVPSVAIHADVFARLVESVARVSGMPRARRAFLPTPVIDRSAEQLYAYLEGDDPVRARPFMAVVVDALTELLPGEDLRGIEFDRSSPRLLEPTGEEDLVRLFRQSGWTDYLPIVLPTEARVEAMLAGTSRGPDEHVGEMRPTSYREPWAYTVEKVAVNAVMAGALPEHLPVILALAATGHTARQSSTTSMGAMVVVNGPIRRELDMNSGIGALGPYNHANAAIGRAYGLLSQNLQGGSVPGETYMGSQGNPFAYSSVTFAENEENSPWEPFHVAQGFAPEESTVSAFYAWGNAWTEGMRSTWKEKVVAMLTAQDPYMGTLLVLDPLAAHELAALGFTERQQLTDWIYEHVRIPARRYWDHFTTGNLARIRADLGIEPYASYLNGDGDDLVPVFEPDCINVVVTGGSTIGQWSSFNARPMDARNDPPGSARMSIDPWR